MSRHHSKVEGRPEWATKVSALREHLGLSQAVFGQKLQSSAMAISRWERGVQEPPSRSYLELGNLAGDPDCWYFWGRAGLRSEDVLRVMPGMRGRLNRSQAHDFEIVTAGSGSKRTAGKVQLVAVPLLKIVAATHGKTGDDVAYLHDAPIESMIAAPREWCPHPSSTSCLRVKGSSMAPIICDGYIVAVDSSQTDRRKLNGTFVIAWKKDRGLTVSRFRRYDHTEVLQPENSEYESITLGRKNESWKIVAKVLWWLAKAP
jgi:SOS-response transcriptional repressor LexA